ncbi:hypothetical protein ACMU_18305 [Actibacterium mucosum KCTC 23349]|uniref:Aminoglycoside phosphotransferase domain-containing protein n=1 Tax=Actibacterium mucosum KCTC 23349 TaxID=1454373 RepID=A0A037ZHX0_9RHOB|nr:phosphotransferase family protein [Actibacterium mucosum]KAJ54380.1 hypothetical protein ACMU_18305 [Actibacterium mucosum KCTC 23349]
MTKPFELDTEILARYLAEQGLTLDRDVAPKRCAGGLANLNFELSVDGQRAILRRAPSGPLPKGAHDMAREHRVLSRLSAHLPLAPRSFHLCEDAAVLGAPFQLIEFRQGRVFRGDDLSAMNPGEDMAAALPGLLAGAMADLHAVDPAACGLDTLGRPAGFVPRNAARWSGAVVTMSDGTPHAGLAREAADLVQARFDGWADGDVTLLHCDIKLDNLILADDGLRAVALLDWDMATLGDPIYDLATLLSYWTEPGDPEGMQRLRQMPTGHAGFPSRDDMAAAYGRATGRSLDTLGAMRALCQLKLAVIFLQLHARWVDGALGDDRYAEFGTLGVELLEYARDVARLGG